MDLNYKESFSFQKYKKGRIEELTKSLDENVLIQLGQISDLCELFFRNDQNLSFVIGQLTTIFKSLDSFPKEIYLFLNELDFVNHAFVLSDKYFNENDNYSSNEGNILLQFLCSSTSCFTPINYELSNSVLCLCFAIFNRLVNRQMIFDLAILSSILDIFKNLVSDTNIEMFNEFFFNNLIMVCFETTQISITCAQFIEKVSLYIPLTHEYNFFFTFFKNFANPIEEAYAPYIYAALKNILSRNQSLIGEKGSFAYNTILDSYLYDSWSQALAFETCCFLKKKEIGEILSNEKIKANIIHSLHEYEHDKRVISALNALIHLIKEDKEKFQELFLYDNYIYKFSLILINLVTESIYKIKIKSGLILSFVITRSPEFYAKCFIKPYSESPTFKSLLFNFKNAINQLLDYENEDNLLDKMLHAIISINKACTSWGVNDELVEQLSNCNILQNIRQLSLHENEKISELATCVLNLLYNSNSE